MPTVLFSGPYRFFFYASDRDEPPHIHIERDDNVAKFWLDPIRLQSSGGFARGEINRIARIVTEHRTDLLEAWNEYFGR
ncbi:MAG TPA: DUF4160 domain-containing protein [Burkholderiales bacterium]|jgi:hypothetical protein